MIITCPSCATRFQIKAEALEPPGRQVRCAKCGHTWFQEPIDETSEQPAPVEDGNDGEETAASEPVIPDRDTAIAGFSEIAAASRERVEERNNHPLRIAAPWVILLGYLVVLGVGGYSSRYSVATLWPRTASFFSFFGAEINLLGLEFANVTVDRENENGVPLLLISGEIINTSHASQYIPDVLIALYDKDHSELYAWSVEPGNTQLAANERTQFNTRLTRPPQDINDFEIRFAGLDVADIAEE